jgi:hypothetical protein
MEPGKLQSLDLLQREVKEVAPSSLALSELKILAPALYVTIQAAP